MNKSINAILLVAAGVIAAIGYIISNVKSGAASAIVFVIVFVTFMAYEPTRRLIVQFLSAIVTLFTKLAENADKIPNRGSANANSNSLRAQSQSKRKCYCKKCGMEYTSVFQLTHGICPENNHGNHVLYQGSIKSQYQCAYCGMNYRTLFSLTHGICPKNNHGKHVPVEDWN